MGGNKELVSTQNALPDDTWDCNCAWYPNDATHTQCESSLISLVNQLSDVGLCHPEPHYVSEWRTSQNTKTSIHTQANLQNPGHWREEQRGGGASGVSFTLHTQLLRNMSGTEQRFCVSEVFSS